MTDNRRVIDAADIGWMPYGGGYEMTRAEKIIRQRLDDLLRTQYPVVISHEGYQSGGRMLQGVSSDFLVIDRPPDWSDLPAARKRVRVVYMDRGGLWNHFYTRVVQTTATSLVVDAPTEYYLMQRRNHFRVSAPAGSIASFISRDMVQRNRMIGNVSAGGMLVVVPEQNMLSLQETLSNLTLELAPDADLPDSQGASISVGQGRVVRTAGTYKRKFFGYGIRFFPTAREEDELVRYVRQRELEMLNKSPI